MGLTSCQSVYTQASLLESTPSTPCLPVRFSHSSCQSTASADSCTAAARQQSLSADSATSIGVSATLVVYTPSAAQISSPSVVVGSCYRQAEAHQRLARPRCRPLPKCGTHQGHLTLCGSCGAPLTKLGSGKLAWSQIASALQTNCLPCARGMSSASCVL